MGQQLSKSQLVYQLVEYGNIDGIKSLRADGAGLEWMNWEGKTPLIVACMNPGLYNVAQTLIELGANVNAYRPGGHAGTPLHHAAKQGLDQTVQLLISHGANALVMIDNCQTPLELARVKGYSNVVRTIEAHICLFSGWLKEYYRPRSNYLSRKVWVVVLPCASPNLRKPFKLELAIYTNIQDPKPRTVVVLWKADIEEPNFNQPEPAVVISDTTTGTRLRLAALTENDKQLLHLFCNACKGIPQNSADLKMGQQLSKDELVYQLVNYGNIDGIKSLRADGAGLEWMDWEGKTPLTVACMNPGHYNVAKTLIELGANVNAYCPGGHAGTPLHHAAKRGLDQTVQLLISHEANALVMIDDCQTPLELARVKGYSNVVRTIEAHICLFSGWLKEFYGPTFLERFAPNYLSRKVWVVVLPCASPNLRKPKLELAIYTNIQDPEPRTVVVLWKANMEEPNFNQPEPAVVISDTTTRTRLRLAALTENDKQLLHLFCNACKGIPQAIPPAFPLITEAPDGQTSAPPNSEHDEPAMQEPDPGPGPVPDHVASSSGTANNSKQDDPDTGIAGVLTAVQHTNQQHSLVIPSAPPAVDDGNPIHYPTCVICLDDLVEGACIPCGHMAGCMSCLNEIKAKNWGCPVCRDNINQVLRIYSV